MTQIFSLESFSTGEVDAATVFLPRGKLEEIRASAHQAGYDLGVEEVRAKANSTRLEAAQGMAATLQDCAFTQAEARHAVLDSLQSLVEKLIDVVLPEIARIGFPEAIAHQLSTIASTITDGPIILRCPEALRSTFEELARDLGDETTEVVIISDSDLDPTEVRISSPESDRHVNLDLAIEHIRESVVDFYQTLEQKQA